MTRSDGFLKVPRLLLGGEDQGRGPVGHQDLRGVGIEGEDPRLAFDGAGAFDGLLNHRGVADVQSIETAGREDDGHTLFVKFF